MGVSVFSTSPLQLSDINGLWSVMTSQARPKPGIQRERGKRMTIILF